MNTTARKTISVFAAIVLGVQLAAAYGADRIEVQGPGSVSPPTTTPVGTDQGLSIAFKTLPDPPRSGDNMVEATVAQADGRPVEDAALSVIFHMPAMPSMNMPDMRADAKLAHRGGGHYRGSVQLVMGGTWYVTVRVSRAGRPTASRRITVIAR